MDKTVQQILKKAKEMNASDIHIIVGTYCRYRINGQLKSFDEEIFTMEDMNNFILSVMQAKVRKLLEENGEIDFTCEIKEIGRCRIHIFKQQGVYGAVLHMIHTKIPTLEQLGMPTLVSELIKKKKGLILITGPSGMGKSTTMSAFLNEMNEKDSRSIVTLENPIEYIHTHKKSLVSQREIGTDTTSYMTGLKAAMMEDADVIMVGEMNEPQTILESLIAAENGHLVFSTLHTIGAVSTIERLIDIFPTEKQQQIRVQLSGVLEAIISQQLIPDINENGQVAAYEIMYMTPTIKNFIKEGKIYQITSTMQSSGRKLGMQTMDEAIFDLYAERKITANKALEFAQDAITLERKLY